MHLPAVKFPMQTLVKEWTARSNAKESRTSNRLIIWNNIILKIVFYQVIMNKEDDVQHLFLPCKDSSFAYAVCLLLLWLASCFKPSWPFPSDSTNVWLWRLCVVSCISWQSHHQSSPYPFYLACGFPDFPSTLHGPFKT